MFSFRNLLKWKNEKQEGFDRGWNSCLEKVHGLLEEHLWVVDEDDPKVIFCDVCGESLDRTLAALRRQD